MSDLQPTPRSVLSVDSTLYLNGWVPPVVWDSLITMYINGNANWGNPAYAALAPVFTGYSNDMTLAAGGFAKLNMSDPPKGPYYDQVQPTASDVQAQVQQILLTL